MRTVVTGTSSTPASERLQLRFTGTVQGVGFRPFVYRHAVALGLTGFVRNDSAGVLIEAEGPREQLAEFGRRLAADAPPLARITSVSSVTLPPSSTPPAGPRFSIVESAEDGPPAVPVSVDTATCADCFADVDDPTNRRYQYPFTNCTNCGPRYTIVMAVPYDRPATTMAPFAMCDTCRKEYDDPADRRFHAQPNACPACGPRLAWLRPDGTAVSNGDAALREAVVALRCGAIVGVKGLGGFHLAVDATDAAAVAELRRRKARDDKPFAVMARDVEMARQLCELDEAAEAVLASIRRPIVVAPRRAAAPTAPGVAPDLPELGVMLPYTPLHHLLVQGAGRPLVMTSGNLSDDPIAHTDEDAIVRLGPMVDAFLTHDRRIHIRCDDSVVRRESSGMKLLRRSRGFAPEPMPLPRPAKRQVLAVGAELKNTVAVAKDTWMVASHHIGDLEHLATYRSFRQAVDHLQRLFGVEPGVIAHDLHPEYLSTKFALDLDLPVWAIQHHHAHVASCLAEHGEEGPVLGLAFDGLGYGTDGALWGGEFLIAGLDHCRRAGHLREVALPGGSAAIREPWRMATAWALVAEGPDAAVRIHEQAGAVVRIIEHGSPHRTTSVGRLFDAVAALAGLRRRVTYEGQAAIELEAAARTVPLGQARRFPTAGAWVDGRLVLDPAPLISAVMEALENGSTVAQVAASFHESLARGAVEVAVELASANGLRTAALTGGVFQNARFSALVAAGLEKAGLRVLTHHEVPPNDGGISIGQAAIAACAEKPPRVE